MADVSVCAKRTLLREEEGVARRFKQEEDRQTEEPAPDNVAYLEKKESGE